jgi:hypothetical protein
MACIIQKKCMADDIIGFRRLFADDTSIGHSALDKASLKKIINIYRS